MPDRSELGDRMKGYEKRFQHQLLRLIPVVARLDGKSFSTFARGLQRPYDERLSDLMIDTTIALVRMSNACIGYTQSDEITLVWLAGSIKSEIFFNGRVEKMISILSAYASVFFNKNLRRLPEKIDESPLFDCRIFNVPNKTEAVNALVWREMDATRNSISMAAQSLYSHNELMHKSCSEMQEMIFKKGINWNDYPRFFKRGTYVQRTKTERPFTSKEIENLPAKHEARTNPELKILRTDCAIIYMPPITQVVNREKVVFEGCIPETAEDVEK